MKVKCAICNKEMERKPSHVKKYKHLFCSDECKRKGATLKLIEKYKEYLQVEDMKEWLYQKYIVERLSLRQIMKLLNTNANNSIRSMLKFYDIEIRHGSEAIKTQWENNDKRRKETANLAKNTILTEESRNKIKEKMKTEEYRKKQSLSKIGEKNPSYNPNLDRINNNSRSIAGNTIWRRNILEKYNYKCDKCNSKDNIQTHHLYNWSSHPEKRFDIDNGVCLCKKCHDEFHKKYGQKNNNPEQYKEYKESD